MREEEKDKPVDGEMEGKASFQEENKDVDNELQENNGDKDKDDDDKDKPIYGGGGTTFPIEK